jgi:hypothetical protein
MGTLPVGGIGGRDDDAGGWTWTVGSACRRKELGPLKKGRGGWRRDIGRRIGGGESGCGH